MGRGDVKEDVYGAYLSTLAKVLSGKVLTNEDFVHTHERNAPRFTSKALVAAALAADDGSRNEECRTKAAVLSKVDRLLA